MAVLPQDKFWESRGPRILENPEDMSFEIIATAELKAAALDRAVQGCKRAAALMSLVHSARLNGYDPNDYLCCAMSLSVYPRSRPVVPTNCSRIDGNRSDSSNPSWHHDAGCWTCLHALVSALRNVARQWMCNASVTVGLQYL